MSKITFLPRLAIVTPCYNEEEVLHQTAKAFGGIINELITKGKIAKDSFICFINDGSRDRTWDIISELHLQNSVLYKGLNLANNAGHQNALLAGLMWVKDFSDCTISIDADLQDDISVMEAMIDHFHEGSDVVYAARNNRDSDSFFKKFTAELFYKLMKNLGVKNLVFNHADYRLASKRALHSLAQFSETNLFLRGIFPVIGYKNSTVYYARAERAAGESKYPLRKMITFAWEGITSFSSVPLRYVTMLGFLTILITLALSVWVLYNVFINNVVPGWASTVLPLYFLGGLQLFSVGIIGEYIAKIYKEVKRRPAYIIESKLN